MTESLVRHSLFAFFFNKLLAGPPKTATGLCVAEPRSVAADPFERRFQQVRALLQSGLLFL